MAKPKSIYSLKGIFTLLLRDTLMTGFLIPTYQRGYKWVSDGKGGQVDILLKDIFEAYKAGKDRYYLQFLTLKCKDQRLEVIDGQQRLTTLTILLSVIYYVDNAPQEENYSSGKLNYQTRQNFVEKYIYNNVQQLLKAADWNEFRNQNEEHDNQDVYFIFKAAKAIHDFITIRLADDIRQFSDFLNNKVHLIVNLLDESLSSERLFINVNKGVKLKDEDLVKGMLITRVPLEFKNPKFRVTEVEINELRTNLGRQWDELSNWAFREDTMAFFKIKSNEDRLDWLIHLAYPEVENMESRYPMFDYLDSLNIQTNTSATDVFGNIRGTKMMLNDWQAEPEIANLLGFVLHALGSPKTLVLWRELKKFGTKQAVLNYLKKEAKKLLPLDRDGNFKNDLNYEEDYDRIFNVFLMMDITKFLPLGSKSSAPYNFGKIAFGDWTLEHIFPQNAKELKAIDKLSKEDLKIVQELIPKNQESLKSNLGIISDQMLTLYDKIKASVKECEITKEQREYLGQLLSTSAPDLHTVGNLALLERHINSGLSNHFFNEKRKILVKKISDGKFVPFHTYDVFSKLIVEAETGLHVWSKEDIQSHEVYITQKLKSVIQYLNRI